MRCNHGENPWAKQTLDREIPDPPNMMLGSDSVGVVEEVHNRSNAHQIGKRLGVDPTIKRTPGKEETFRGRWGEVYLQVLGM